MSEMFAGRFDGDPHLQAEQAALTQGVLERAAQWREGPIVLPRGVEIVEGRDEQGRPGYGIEWGTPALISTPVCFSEPALAAEVVWTVFMLRRPRAIDDERLRLLVDEPPAPCALIFGHLLSIRTADWVRRAVGTAVIACTQDPPPAEDAVFHRAIESMAFVKRRYEARAALSINELSGLLDVEEPDAGLFYEIGRWRWMLHDYAEGLGKSVHDRVIALAVRFDRASMYESKPVREALADLSALRQLDASTGLLLAQAALLEAEGRPRVPGSYVDPLSTKAPGSVAWWCAEIIECWRYDDVLVERLSAEEIEEFVEFAGEELGELDRELRDVLLQAFPWGRSESS